MSSFTIVGMECGLGVPWLCPLPPGASERDIIHRRLSLLSTGAICTTFTGHGPLSLSATFCLACLGHLLTFWDLETI